MCRACSLQIKNKEEGLRDGENYFLAHRTVLNEAEKKIKREPALSVGACLTQVGL